MTPEGLCEAASAGLCSAGSMLALRKCGAVEECGGCTDSDPTELEQPIEALVTCNAAIPTACVALQSCNNCDTRQTSHNDRQTCTR